MTEYFKFISLFLLISALLNGLANIPGLVRINKWIKANSILILAASLIMYFKPNDFSKLPYILSISFILIAYNLYILTTNIINIRRKLFRIIFDLCWCGLTLFISSTIIAYVNDLPIRNITIENFADGYSIFKPGYFYEMFSNSITFSLILICCKYFYNYLLDKWSRIQRLKIYKFETEKKNIEIQYETLQAKVNPHFLYNALNSIAGLATVDGEKTREMSLALSNFFKYSMNREQQAITTVNDEMLIIETYLEIEKIRFGEKLVYDITGSDDALVYKIPRMLILPIVENCIKHAIPDDKSVLKIDITFTTSDKKLIISIADNGKPFHKNFIPGFGIKSVYDKLDLLFSDKYSIEIKTRPLKLVKIILSQECIK